MLSCTFAGHREIRHPGVSEAVEDALARLLSLDDEFCFYSGGMGEFDNLCEAAVRSARQRHPQKHIRLLLVKPYMLESLNKKAAGLRAAFDEIVIPMELADCHRKAAIAARNRWMIDRCQYLLAYVTRPDGGAAAALRYAEKRGLTVWRVGGE